MAAVKGICTAVIMLVLCLNCAQAAAPKVLDSTYEVRTGSLLGREMTVAIFTVTFDQDLYIPEPKNFVDGYDCALQDLSTRCICDYTLLNNACGTGHLPDGSSCVCNDTAQVCNSDTFMDVALGKDYPVVFKPNTYFKFRFLFDAPCMGISVNVSMHDGAADIYLNTEPNVDKVVNHKKKSLYSFDGSSLYAYLPPGDFKFERGTWFAALWSRHVTCNITIRVEAVAPVQPPAGRWRPSVESRNVETEITEANNRQKRATECTNILPTHQCLDENVPQVWAFPTGLSQAFTYQVTNCSVYTIIANPTEPNAGFTLFISTDPANPVPGSGTTEILSNHGPGGWLYASFCPIDANTPLTLYINVYCWSGGNASVSITSQAQVALRPIRNLLPPGDTYGLISTSRFVRPGGSYYYCRGYIVDCDKYWAILPSTVEAPWWPLPVILRGNSDYQFIGNQTNPQLPLLSNVYMSVLLLDYTEEGKVTTNIAESEIASSSIQFLGRLVNSEGLPVSAVTTPRRVYSVCDPVALAATKEDVDYYLGLMDEATDYNELNSLLYKLDTLTFTENWSTCDAQALALLTYNDTVSTQFTDKCLYSQGTTEYETDPCCNDIAAWDSCCLPKQQQVTTRTYNGVNATAVSQSCGNPECSTSFLQDYLQLVNTLDVEGCVLTKAIVEYQHDVLLAYRTCSTNSFYTVSCYSDSECNFGAGAAYKCDLAHHKCLIPLAAQEYAFVSCVLNAVDDVAVLQYIKDTIGYSDNTTVITPSFIMAFMAQHTIQDCVDPYTMNLAIRNHYSQQWEIDCSVVSVCIVDGTCADDKCVKDKNPFCVFCEWTVWVPVSSAQSTCLSDTNKYCNWNSSLSGCSDAASCQSACMNPPAKSTQFCGLCEDGQDCTEVSQYTDQASCEAASVCVLPDGSVNPNLTADQCGSIGACSMYCPPTCASKNYPSGDTGACFATTATDATSCAAAGATWDTASGACVFVGVTRAQCTGQNQAYQACSDLPSEACFYCQFYPAYCAYPTANKYLGCYLNTQTMCSTPEQCASSSGLCTDSFYLMSTDVSVGAFYGGCVLPRKNSTNLNSVLPYCEAGTALWPDGCLDLAQTQLTCATNGGVWTRPSWDSATCLGAQGCTTYVTGYLFNNWYGTDNLQSAVNGQDQGNCSSCGLTWNPKFYWLQGQWMSGQMRTLSWMSRNYTDRYSWSYTLNFTKVADTIFTATNVRLALQYRSLSLCRYKRVSQLLTTISCGCANSYLSTESNPPELSCYDNISGSVPVAVSGPCVATTTTSTGPFFVITFDNSSIPNQCVDVTVSQYSVLGFRNPPATKLSGDFVSFEKAGDYQLTNKNKAIVGTVLGDGIIVQTSGTVSSMKICVQLTRIDYSGKTVDDYPVLDWAYTKSSTELEPYGYTNLVYANGTVCGIVHPNADAVVMNSNDVTYFPIARTSNYQDETRTLGSAETVCSYILAVMFLVVSIFALVQTSLVVVAALKGLFRLQMRHGLSLFIFLFNIIRSIYFFMLPSDVLSNSEVADYILVALPTFFYFTAFTIIVILWASLSVTKVENTIVNLNRMPIITIVINSIIYALFVIIVLVFHFSDAGQTTTCAGRLTSDETVSPQKAVSIAYATFIAFISLVLGIAFLFFGGKMYRSLTQVGGQVKNTEKQMLSIFWTTVVCSVVFILHCIFILVLVAAEVDNIAYSFVGLTVTEAAPSLYILIKLDSSKHIITNISSVGASLFSRSKSFHTRDDAGN